MTDGVLGEKSRRSPSRPHVSFDRREEDQPGLPGRHKTDYRKARPASLNSVHINAHGGGILLHEGLYSWYGEHKIATPPGNSAEVAVHVYPAEDLYRWKDEGIALTVIENDTLHDITKGCILERPKVIYNEKNRKFVMWFHLTEYLFTPRAG